MVHRASSFFATCSAEELKHLRKRGRPLLDQSGHRRAASNLPQRLFLKISGSVAGATRFDPASRLSLAVMENVHGDHKI